MKPLFFVSLTALFLCFSCGSSSSSNSKTIQDPHAKMHQEMHSELYQEEILKVLDGKWMITKVSDTTIDSTDFDNKLPEMIFDVSQQKVAGNDGCNSFHGKVEIKTDKMVFGPVATTLMACPNMELSDKIMKSFSEKELTYSYNKDLTLYEGDQEVMVLKRPE